MTEQLWKLAATPASHYEPTGGGDGWRLYLKRLDGTTAARRPICVEADAQVMAIYGGPGRSSLRPEVRTAISSHGRRATDPYLTWEEPPRTLAVNILGITPAPD
jgi:hypothetical protein